MADELTNLKPVPGSRHPRKRLGRGEGSGLGRTSGKGQKGQKARAGGTKRPGFEGGQMPLYRRLPKRGFTNVFAKDYTVVNVALLEGRFEAGAEVDAQILKKMGLISRVGADGLKVLGQGDLTTALVVRAAKFSGTARTKIEACGGRAEAV